MMITVHNIQVSCWEGQVEEIHFEVWKDKDVFRFSGLPPNTD